MIGKTVGKYRIEETIGGSHTSQIYKAVDVSNNKPVAIKVLHPHVKSPETVERFKREAKLLLPLKHKNIVSVLDCLTDEENSSLLVLEYVNGRNLKDLIEKEKKILPDIALMIVREISLGLKQAHFEKIVHRDLKPENVLITGEGIIKISDFSLAHFLEAEGITKPGTVIGTPAFMSPEQIKGMPVDSRSDIFSLGVIFYLLISNQFPFDGESKKEVFEKILKHYPVPLNEYVPNVPLEIIKIVERCLEKEIETRYLSVDQLLHDIDSYLSYYGMQEYEGYLMEYLRDPSVGEEQIKHFVVDTAIRSGFKYYYVGDKDEVLRFFKKLTDIKRLTEDSLDTIIKRKKKRGVREIVITVAGIIILVVLSYFAGRWTQTPVHVRVEPAAEATGEDYVRVIVTPTETPAFALATPIPTKKPKARKVVQATPIQVRTPIAETAGTGEVKILTNPWAHVYIDGKYYGQTPLNDTVLLPKGTHQLTLKNPECQDYSDDFTISKNEVLTKEINLAYKPSQIRINVPDGANLYVDDQLVDLNNEKNPFNFVLGRHEIRVEKPGYEPLRKEIEIIGGKDLNLNIELKKLK